MMCEPTRGPLGDLIPYDVQNEAVAYSEIADEPLVLFYSRTQSRCGDTVIGLVLRHQVSLSLPAVDEMIGVLIATTSKGCIEHEIRIDDVAVADVDTRSVLVLLTCIAANECLNLIKRVCSAIACKVTTLTRYITASSLDELLERVKAMLVS